MPNQIAIPPAFDSSVAGMQRASRGIEKAGGDIVRGGLQRAEAIGSKDRIELSESARSHLRGEAPKGMEESMVDLKQNQIAYEASAKVAKMASSRSDAFAELIARHQ